MGGGNMKTNKKFSVIEMMTVILVILLLISLTIPIFTKVKMNAKTTLCKSQLRQIGVLITSYVADNRGYLPDDRFEDYCGGNDLYENWSGHLLPYLASTFTSYTANDNYVVLSDAYEKGGHDELKTFICPEIHNNTYDVNVFNTCGMKTPRVSKLSLGVLVNNGYDGGILKTEQI